MGSCSALHSKMMQFCSTEKYCDIKVRVQGTSFPCHRVVLASASEYFDALFGGSFMEKDARETVLHDIDVEIFQEILRCVYTAEMCEITSSNVFDLLSASLFLRIHALEKACTEYIRNNVRSLQNHNQILSLARSFNITALIDFIIEDVIHNFSLFYNNETLLEMTFDDSSFLLDRWSENESPFKCEDLLLHFLIRWVHHASEERSESFIKLIAAVDFERISPNYVTFVMQYYKDFVEQPDLEGMPPLKQPRVTEESGSTLQLPVANWHNDAEDSKKRLWLKEKLSKYYVGNGKLSATRGEEIPLPSHDTTIYKDVLGLHLYVEYVSINHESARRSEGVKVLSSNKYYPWFVSCETIAWQRCTGRHTVVQESTNLLYCMETFENRHNSADSRQTFCTYASIDCALASSVLNSPPVPLTEGHFNMCATSENDMYLFNFRMRGCDEYKSFANNRFSVEEIYRGFYHYNCEVDKWFPAPKMETRQDSPSVCADHHNLIYSIGGGKEGSCFSCDFQTFDYRSGKWMTLPECPSGYHDDLGSNSCVLQDKVFVTRGPVCSHSYDTIAGKWEFICEPTEEYDVRYLQCKMVPYDNKLWLLMYKSFHGYQLVTYCTITQEWYHYEDFNNVIIRNQPNRTDGIFEYNWDIKDMITFKTCSS